jgi:hypothetical protein
MTVELNAIQGDERDDAFPTVRAGVVPAEWLSTRGMGTATASSLRFADIAHSESVAHLCDHRAARLLHYGLEDFDAGDLRRRAPRALTQEVSRYVFEYGGSPDPPPLAGIRYRFRLGDDLENWALFEGNELDEIQAADEIIAIGDTDLLAAWRHSG